MKTYEDKEYWQSNIDWLLERFPEGKYQDITGLCKAATIEGEDGIKEQVANSQYCSRVFNFHFTSR